VKDFRLATSLQENTLPQLLLKRAAAVPGKVAYREKDYGIWNEVTWAEVARQVRWAALGLFSLGVTRGDRVSIIADNIPEWPIMELAAQSLGAVTIGVYQSSVKEELRYLMGYAEASVVLAEDQEQVDKLLEIRSSIPSVRKVIFEDPRGMRDYLHDELLMSWEQLLCLGRQCDGEQPELFEEYVSRGSPDDVCHLSTTSGTTGRPKAAMLSHRNYLSMALALHEVDPVAEGDDYVSYLPFAWIVEQVFAVALPLVTGMVVNFPESSETTMEDLKEIGPHMMLGAPRVWEGVQSSIWVKMNETYPLNRWVYHLLMAVGRQAAGYRMAGRPMPLFLRFLDLFARAVLFRPLKDQLGFLRLKRAYTGGAALGPDTFRFFQGMGVNLKQVYGQTETAGLAYVQRDGEVKPDTVGRPLPGVEVRISEAGEVMTRCAGICHGYFRQEEAFRQMLEEGAWFRSGDAGYIDDDGHLVIIDRMRDVMHTSSGHMFSPQFIENKLKFSPFIKEAIIFGDDRPFVAAMINVDPMTMGKWAEDRGIGYTTYADLSRHAAVGELILREVGKVNSQLQEDERIVRLVLLYKLLDADDEELTRTGKVRRRLIGDRYRDILEALYDGNRKAVQVRVEFRYQDGQTTELETKVAILEPGSQEAMPEAVSSP